MLLLPDQFAGTPVRDLLHAAGMGRVGMDHAFVKSLLDRGPEAAPEITGYAMDQPEEDKLDLSLDLFHVLRGLRHPAALPFFIALLHQDDGEESDHIYEALGELGQDAVEPLLKIWEESEGDARSNAEFLLAGLGVKDDRIRKILLDRLESDPGDAAIHLSLYGDRSLMPAIENRIKSLDESAEGYADQKRELEYSLRNLEAPSIEDGHPPYDVYENFPETASPAWDVLEGEELIEFLSHPAASVRQEAAEALIDEAPSEAACDALLKLVDNDPEAAVRGSAWQSLGEYWEEDAIASRLRAKAQEKDAPPLERAGAAIAVASQELNPEVESVLRELYENPDTRASAMRGMWRTFDKRFSDVFSQHLHDPLRPVQNEAIIGVGYLGLSYEAKKLEDMFEDPDLRERALFSYALCCPGDFSRSTAKRVFRKISDLAEGLSEEETDVVHTAIDTRLAMHGMAPVFAEAHSH